MRKRTVTRIHATGEREVFDGLDTAVKTTGISRYVIKRLAATGKFHGDGSRFEVVDEHLDRAGWRMVSLLLEPPVHEALKAAAKKRDISTRLLARQLCLDFLAKQPGTVAEDATVVGG